MGRRFDYNKAVDISLRVQLPDRIVNVVARRISPRIVLLLAVLPLVSCLLSCRRASAAEDGQVQYRRDVLPILSENCFACHGFDEKARQSGLRLDVSAGATSAADSGEPAIVPGDPDASFLLQRILSDDPDLRMPPEETGKTLTASQQAVLRKWIQQGATYQKHWSFEKPEASAPPASDDMEHSIDRFIQSRLAAQGLRPSPKSSDETLLRRVSLDLTGLPPTVEQLDAFIAARQQDPDAAYQAVVSQLLDSPHYGERWGRWWLDQARYADSNGYSIDAPRQIWKFRDWVINSLNQDMPFDQFTIEQLAGDLLPEATQSQKIATGFHRNTQINQEGGIDKEQFRVDSVFDRVATTGTVWFGLTIGCAQCHDHKFDPVSQKEYYQLFAFFNNQDEPSITVYDDAAAIPEKKSELQKVEQEVDAYIRQYADVYQAWEQGLTDDEKKKMSRAVQKALGTEPSQRTAQQRRDLFGIEVGKIRADYQALHQRLERLEGEVKGATTTMVMQERSELRQTTVLIKGDFTRPAEQVTPATPAILHPLQASSASANRLDLARWIVSEDNPLTARVIVNRVWQVYFGRGLVESENDFGSLGTPPTHPELLDWLAVEFQKTWSLKALHRLIVSSHTYQQTSAVRDDLNNVDPKNYLLGRQQRLRLDAEIIRDVCLSVSGLLSAKMGGAPVYPPIPGGVMNRGQVQRSWNVSDGEDRYRRGVYTFVYRATPPPSLNVFDAPDGYSSCTRRSRSNTPLQALTLLNDSGFVDFAAALEKRIESEGLEIVFRCCTGRRPAADELAVLENLSAKSMARVLLNLDETITRE